MVGKPAPQRAFSAKFSCTSRVQIIGFSLSSGLYTPPVISLIKNQLLYSLKRKPGQRKSFSNPPNKSYEIEMNAVSILRPIMKHPQDQAEGELNDFHTLESLFHLAANCFPPNNQREPQVSGNPLIFQMHVHQFAHTQEGLSFIRSHTFSS